MRKITVLFQELETKGPVLVETGTNVSLPEGVGIIALKKAIHIQAD